MRREDPQGQSTREEGKGRTIEFFYLYCPISTPYFLTYLRPSALLSRVDLSIFVDLPTLVDLCGAQILDDNTPRTSVTCDPPSSEISPPVGPLLPPTDSVQTPGVPEDTGVLGVFGTGGTGPRRVSSSPTTRDVGQSGFSPVLHTGPMVSRSSLPVPGTRTVDDEDGGVLVQ